MTDQQVTDRRFPAADLVAFIMSAYRAVGLSADAASNAAQLMAEADLVGADAHGIFRLPQYIERIEAGGINRHPDIAVTRTAPATARVDGDNGLGHLVVNRAAETAIAMARETGVAWVGIRGSNHAGAASVYAALPMAAGMIGIYSAVASANHMAPWGGTDLFSAPILWSLPCRSAPAILSSSTRRRRSCPTAWSRPTPCRAARC